MITASDMFSCECPALNSEPTNSILATRTLTTLISTLESAPTFRARFEYGHGHLHGHGITPTPTTSSSNTGNNRGGGLQELQIPNAFATLLSRDRENATVASRVAVQKQTNDVNVDLVVCFDSDSDVSNHPELATARESREADELQVELELEGPFLSDSESALPVRHPEKPYSLIESDHAGFKFDVSKSPDAFVKECL